MLLEEEELLEEEALEVLLEEVLEEEVPEEELLEEELLEEELLEEERLYDRAQDPRKAALAIALGSVIPSPPFGDRKAHLLGDHGSRIVHDLGQSTSNSSVSGSL